MRRRRKRIITIEGTRRDLSPESALRFQVVRGVLTGTMSLYEGALKLGLDIDDLAALVCGARQAVIRALGEDALDRFDAQAAA
jgi:hypothetical protein